MTFLIIFHIDENKMTRQMVELSIKNEADKIYGFDSLENLLTQKDLTTPDLIILNSKDLIGDIISLKQYSKTSSSKIMCLTEINDTITKTKAYDIDVEDYITLPFEYLEFRSRTKAILRRIGSRETDVLTYKNITINNETREVAIDGNTVVLTLKEFNILYILMKNNGRIVTKDKLFSEVWKKESQMKSRTLDMHINTLRGKLSDKGFLIKTVRGVGYKI